MVFVTCILALTGCDDIDCSLNNTVECKLAFYSSKGDAVALTDTLTITATGTDSVLFNRGIRTSSVALPLSHNKDKDTLTLNIYSEDYSILEQLIITKRSYTHIESVDCPLKTFHVLEKVESTHHIIDTAMIVAPQVIFNNGENIQIYLRSND